MNIMRCVELLGPLVELKEPPSHLEGPQDHRLLKVQYTFL